MKKIILIAAAALLSMPSSLLAQGKYFTREGNIYFTSTSTVEKIEATNKKVTSIIDTETGQIEFAVLMKAFEFEKALMQEHFNENYVESDKFPKAVFKGAIVNKGDVKWTTDGTYPVKVSGKMTLHGVTKDITTDGTIEVKGGKVLAKAAFSLLLKDYNIEIPKLVADKISESVNVKVDLNLDPYKAN